MRSEFCLLLSVALVPVTFALKRAAPAVDLGYAKYEGTFNATSGVTSFLGIRYAAPPIGDLRWREPQVPANSPEVQKADTFGNVCYGAGGGTASSSPFREALVPRDAVSAATIPTKPPSEDCLFLNIWTPTTLDSKHKLPVIFWIHGGGYQLGDAIGFQGTDLLNTSKNGVVVVTVQYRLSVFGFLPGEEVKRNGVLNAGLLDQQFALRWVQKHISKFGGDPERVTIWGESAGAGSVLQHVIANGGKTTPPLFRGAITSSPFLPSQYEYNNRVPEILYKETVGQTNCSRVADTLDCLRKVDVSLLQSANVNISASGFFGTYLWVPVVDGTFILERPTEALKQRRVNGDVLLTINNAHEGALFIDPNTPKDVDVANYVAQLFPNFNDEQIKATVAQYENVGTQQSRPSHIIGDSIFVCPSYYLHNGFGGKGFRGEFAIPPGDHGQDLFFYWPTYAEYEGGFASTTNYTNPIFTKAFAQSFVNFAISLDPNVKVDSSITPNWAPWDGENEMRFNRTEAGLPDVQPFKTDSALLSRCKFWESIGAFSGQ